MIHAIKAALDDLNYQCYKAKEALGDKVETDETIKDFFTHSYPGKTLEIYEEVFGDPQNAITRKRFTDEVRCPVGGLDESVIGIIDRINKGAYESLDGVPLPPPTFMGIPLTRNANVFIPPIN